MDPELEAQLQAMNAEGNTNPSPPPPPAPDYAALLKQQQEANAVLQQQVQQALQQNQQLVQQIQSTQPTNQQPDLFANVDDGTKKLLQSLSEQIKRDIGAENQQLKQQIAEVSNQLAISKIGNANVPPFIAQRAQAIYQGMAKNGTPLTHDDALRFAIGEAVQAGTYVPPRNTNPQPTVMVGGSPQPRSGSSNKRIPPNIDALPYYEQIAIYEQVGVDKEEF